MHKEDLLFVLSLWMWNLKRLGMIWGLVDVDTKVAQGHVGEIERGIFLLKERVQYVVTQLNRAGIIYLHRQIVFQLLYMVTIFVNALPATEGILRHYLPPRNRDST